MRGKIDNNILEKQARQWHQIYFHMPSTFQVMSRIFTLYETICYTLAHNVMKFTYNKFIKHKNSFNQNEKEKKVHSQHSSTTQ